MRPTSSHRIKIEERKLYKKAALFIAAMIGFGIFMIFIGVPVFAQAILFISGFRKDKTPVNVSVSENALFPPSLDPLSEATNTATIALSGYGEKDASVVVFVNDKETKKAQTDSIGKFFILNLPIKEGSNIITAKSIKDDKESSPSSSFTVSYLNKPPKLDIDSPHDGDKFSSEKKQAIVSGITDPDNRITVNDRMVVVNTQGQFRFAYPLSEGDNELTIKAYDPAGNSSEKKIKV